MNINNPAQSVFQLGDNIAVVPVVHGSVDFAMEVRRIMLSQKWDCVAVPLPSSMQDQTLTAVQQLPVVQVVSAEEPGEPSAFNYIPVDPCQPVIAALRIALQEYIPIEFIDREVAVFEPDPFPSPDPYSLKYTSIEKYVAAMIPAFPKPNVESQVYARIQTMAYRLKELSRHYKNILHICSLSHWVWLRDCYLESEIPELAEPFFAPVKTTPVQERSLVFVLGELPYITYQYEKARRELEPEETVSIDGIKQLLIETRDEWLKNYKPLTNWATPQRLKLLLQYIRNLTLIHSRLTPDLYTMALAAKQVIGDTFAVSLLETAKQYPYQHIEEKGTAFGVNQIQLQDGGGGEAKNRLQGPPVQWRNLPLKRVPEEEKQKQWQQKWNPFGICSFPPEDSRIESFNTHVREAAKSLIGEGLFRTEKFSSSIKDGLDIRETIRNWHTGDIYVKEIPPARGTIEVVVFLFDVPADPMKYSMQTTWYAEHAEESTLSFFGTPVGEKFVGPGIAQCTYGGCMFLFPPRYITDIWMDRRFQQYKKLEDRLLAGAFFHSKEKYVTVVSPKPPTQGWRWLAKRYKKKIVHIPLSRFSKQMVDRIRLFHVLNGKQVRSYASKFIREM